MKQPVIIIIEELNANMKQPVIVIIIIWLHLFVDFFVWHNQNGCGE